MSRDEEAVLRAAAHLIARFAAHDMAGYFACFEPEASFIFHNEPSFMTPRAAYEAVWRRWESQDGFRVIACRSFDQRVRIIGDVGIYTHQLDTHLSFSTGEQKIHERETIIFHRQPDGSWLAVHEHLSPYNFT
jgi:ketosteroid isomerase-like protein